MSPGQRHLARVLQLTKGREVAARCHVSPSRVSAWLSGNGTPSAVPRAFLESIYDIPSSCWPHHAEKRARSEPEVARRRPARTSTTPAAAAVPSVARVEISPAPASTWLRAVHGRSARVLVTELRAIAGADAEQAAAALERAIASGSADAIRSAMREAARVLDGVG